MHGQQVPRVTGQVETDVQADAAHRRTRVGGVVAVLNRPEQLREVDDLRHHGGWEAGEEPDRDPAGVGMLGQGDGPRPRQPGDEVMGRPPRHRPITLGVWACACLRIDSTHKTPTNEWDFA